MRSRNANGDISVTLEDVEFTALYRGKRHYELSNHLGNVQVVVSDKRISVCDSELEVEYFKAEVLSAVDYYPFGMMMPDRQWYANSDSSIAVNGFNGMRKDDEISGVGNSLDFGARIYDSRLGRWMSLDPLQKKYPSLSHYGFVNNTPLQAIDPNGKSHFYLIWKTSLKDEGHVAIAVMNYKTVIDANGNSVKVHDGTYSIYGLVPNSHSAAENAVMKDPDDIQRGHMEETLVEEKDFKNSTLGGYKVDLVYKIESTPEQDERFKQHMEKDRSGAEIPQYGDDATPKYENEINYKVTANGASAYYADAYNCTSYAVIRANSIYNDGIYAGEYVDFDKTQIFGVDIAAFQGMVFTPGALIDALESSDKATKLKGDPSHGAFVDTYSGGKVKDNNPEY